MLKIDARACMSAMLNQLVKTSSKRIDGEKVKKILEPSISIPFFFFMQHKKKSVSNGELPLHKKCKVASWEPSSTWLLRFLFLQELQPEPNFIGVSCYQNKNSKNYYIMQYSNSKIIIFKAWQSKLDLVIVVSKN